MVILRELIVVVFFLRFICPQAKYSPRLFLRPSAVLQIVKSLETCANSCSLMFFSSPELERISLGMVQWGIIGYRRSSTRAFGKFTPFALKHFSACARGEGGVRRFLVHRKSSAELYSCVPLPCRVIVYSRGWRTCRQMKKKFVKMLTARFVGVQCWRNLEAHKIHCGITPRDNNYNSTVLTAAWFFDNRDTEIGALFCNFYFSSHGSIPQICLIQKSLLRRLLKLPMNNTGKDLWNSVF